MRILCALLLSLTLLSCGPSMVDLAIDNPTDESIIVTIDELVVEVPPKEVVWVEMGKGKHKVTLESDSIVEYDFTSSVYMLNPALVSYLKFEQLYGSNTAAMMNAPSSIPYDTVNYLGLELTGNYALVEGLINPVTWDYGAREVLPEMIEMDSYASVEGLVKIMDPWEFIEEVQKGQDESESTTE